VLALGAVLLAVGGAAAKGLFTVNVSNLKVEDFVFTSAKPDIRPVRLDRFVTAKD